MTIEMAVLVFLGNAVLFFLWTRSLVPWVRELMEHNRSRCPHCGMTASEDRVVRRAL